MSLETEDNALMCKIFSSSLSGMALSWFRNLKPNSIISFQELIELFITHFFGNQKLKKTLSTLLSTNQNPNESLHEFMV